MTNTIFRISFITALVLCLPMISAQAAGVAPAQVLERLQQGASQDLVVVFDDGDIEQQAKELRKSLRSDLDTPSILSYKRSNYKKLKANGLPSGQDGLSVVKDYQQLPMSLIRVKHKQALDALLSNAAVAGIYENEAHQANLSQSLALINQPIAQSAGKTGAGTTVAVLDTGVDYRRAAFGYCTAPGVPAGCSVSYARDFAPQDNSLDSHGHGTNVAGIVVGVAPGAKIAALDVFNGGSAYTADILSAIDWSIQNQAAYNIVAINMSLGIPGSRYLSYCNTSWATTPFRNARAAGILPVVASGNDGFKNGINNPACAPGAVSVGAVYDSALGAINWGICADSSTAADKVTCFSNSASILTLLAPGSVISAAGISMSGTSQATPHVAGATAVLRAVNAYPTDTLEQTVARMTGIGKPIYDAKSRLTKPRLDVGKAVGL